MKKIRKITSSKKLTVTKKRRTMPRKKRKNIINNKGLTYIIFVGLLLTAIVIGVVFMQKISNDISKDQNPIQTSANTLKTQAIQLLHSNPARAKTLFQQARQKYQEISDRNNIVDVEAQLYLIEHIKTTK